MSTCVSYLFKVSLMVIFGCYMCCAVSHIIDWFSIINYFRFDLIVKIRINYLLKVHHRCIAYVKQSRRLSSDGAV